MSQIYVPGSGGGGSGNVSGPGSSTVGDIVTWADTTGTTIADSGVAFPIPLNKGGTAANLTASNGGIFYSNATTGAILSGTATANKVLISGSSTSPSWSIPTFPASASATSRKIIVSDGTNWVASTETYAVPGTSGNIMTSDGTNWTSAAPLSGGLTWSDTSGSFTAVKSNGYFITGTSTPTMPASPSVGDTISFFLDAAATLTITGNTGQTIRLGSSVSAAAGTCVSASRGNAITLIYRSTDTCWCAISSVGTWTIT